MWRFVLLALLLLSSSARSGEVDDRFVTGPMGILWGAGVEEAKAAFGDGLLWPVRKNPDNVDLIYGVQGNGKLYWQDIPIQLIQFAFTNQGKLVHAFLSFDARESDQVLQHCIDLFGRNYRTKDSDFETETVYSWATSSTTGFVLKISKRQPYIWVQLGAYIDSKKPVEPKSQSPQKGA